VNLYKPNPHFEATFRHSDEARAYALAKAEEGAQHARANAPVASAEYRDSIEADVEETPEGWAGLVIAGAPHSVYVEFGTEDTPTFATLRRAGEIIERS
jgi:hypothetical protein